MDSEKENKEEFSKIYERAIKIVDAKAIPKNHIQKRFLIQNAIKTIFIFEKIKSLICEDNIEKSIEFLRILLHDKPIYDELVITSARYNDLKRKIRINTINWENQNVEKNKIRKAILEIISDLENDLSNAKLSLDDEDTQNKPPNTAKSLLSAGKQLYRMTSKFLSEELQENQKAGDFFQQIGNTLQEIADSFRKGEIPHGSCGKLEFYSKEIMGLISHVVGKNKAWELQRKLMYTLDIEHQLYTKVKKSEIGLIDQAAGYFQAFADTIKNLPYPNYERYKQIKEKIIDSRSHQLMELLEYDEVSFIEFLLDEENFKKLDNSLNMTIRKKEKK